MVEQAQDFFRESFYNDPAVVAYAPGRIEFVGNHTDYNGGKVLGIAIQQGIYCALSYRKVHCEVPPKNSIRYSMTWARRALSRDLAEDVCAHAVPSFVSKYSTGTATFMSCLVSSGVSQIRQMFQKADKIEKSKTGRSFKWRYYRSVNMKLTSPVIN